MKNVSKTLLSIGLLAGMAMSAQADGDPEKGKRVFMKCKSCHVMEAGKRRMGPSLAGIFGKEAGSMEGFKYSKAMKDSGIVWDDATMTEFLRSPRKYLKGTKMGFAGIRKDEQIADLIAWMKENGG